jgi:hypothetical protein
MSTRASERKEGKPWRGIFATASLLKQCILTEMMAKISSFLRNLTLFKRKSVKQDLQRSQSNHQIRNIELKTW